MYYYSQSTSSFSKLIKGFSWSGEWGFQLYMYIIKFLSSNSTVVFLFISSFIIVGGIIYFWSKESSCIELCMAVYMLGGGFVSGMNGIRQAIVASIFIANYKLIKEKKYLHYFALCLLLSMIHKSALILIPMIFILNFKPWNTGTWGLLLSSIILYLGYPLFAGFLTNMLEGTTYGIYSEGIMNFSHGGANVLRVAVLLVPIILAYVYNDKLKKEFSYYGICLNGAIMSFIFMLIASIRSWIFARPCLKNKSCIKRENQVS